MSHESDPVETDATIAASGRAAIDVDHSPQKGWRRLDNPLLAGFLLTAGALLAIALGFAVRDIANVLIYIVFAMFFALGLNPVVQWLTRRGLSRAWSIVVTIIGLLVVVAGVLWMVIPTVVDQITQFVQSVPQLVDNFMASDLFHRMQDTFGDQIESGLQDAQKFLTDPNNIATIGGGALQVGMSVASAISGGIVVIVLTLYFVATLPSMQRSLVRLTAARSRARVSAITDQITESVGGYLGGMVVLAFLNAVVAGILHAVLGLPYPLLMGVVAFLITLIPLVGSVLFWAVATLLALFTGPMPALIFGIAYLAYMQVEAYVLTPRVMSRAVSVPGALVVIGALVGGTLLGLLGALVAIPVTASILIIIKQVWVPRQDAKV